MKFFLGIDNGGTNTKAAVFDSQGKQLAAESISTASIKAASGVVEIDMEEMWHSTCLVIRRLLHKLQISPREIAGIGICGHGKGLYLWGKDNKPVRRGILSSDNRAWKYPLRWREDGTEAAAFELSCQHTLSCQPVSLLAWLRDNEPETVDKTEWIFECKDYIRFRLTGNARAELTDYSGTGLLNLHDFSYDAELLRLYGIEMFEQALPPLCASLDICGTVSDEAARETGLASGTPVIGGMFDIDACCLGVGVYDQKNICMIAGTWSINEYLSKAPIKDGSVLMNSLFCLPGYYLIEESSPTSAGNLEWFIQQLLPELKAVTADKGKNIYDVLNPWVEELSPDEFLPVFLPFLTASNIDALARAAFIGLNASHTRKHIIRSVYEGVAFSHRYHFDKLMAARKNDSGHIRLAGGVTNSRVWSQIFADVMNMPVDTLPTVETGALGCCIAAATALGCYGSIEEAVVNMCSDVQTFYPDKKAHSCYEKKYNLYLKAIESLRDFWPAMQQLIDGTD